MLEITQQVLNNWFKAKPCKYLQLQLSDHFNNWPWNHKYVIFKIMYKYGSPLNRNIFVVVTFGHLLFQQLT